MNKECFLYQMSCHAQNINLVQIISKLSMNYLDKFGLPISIKQFDSMSQVDSIFQLSLVFLSNIKEIILLFSNCIIVVS